jgi:xanthine dehydrogenase accessory factor
MKHWKETEQILGRAAELTAQGQPAALATVVRIAGSAYRRPGAKFLVEAGGGTIGGVSGGCLEADVCEVARAVMRTGAPRLLHYDTGSDDSTVWGLGLGCNGTVDVFVQPASALLAGGLLAALRQLLRGDEPFAVSTVVRGASAGTIVHATGRLPLEDQGGAETDEVASSPAGPTELDARLHRLADQRLARGESGLDEIGADLVFTDVLLPPPRLFVFGAGDDARPLVAFAARVGFQVIVVDHREAYLTTERFPDARRLVRQRPDDGGSLPGLGPRASAVVMNHSLALDRGWLARLRAGGAAYIGVLGPRARIEEILRQAGAAGDERVFGPVGLDLGADGPEEIAVSIVAELLAVRAGREPRHLRDRRTAIHAA